MKHTFEQKIYYGDTDAYGVVWHATYLRWLEIGRAEFVENLGFSMAKMKEEDFVLTVVDMNLRYKSSALLNDTIIIETEITNVSPVSVTFTQTIKNKETNAVHLIAEVKNVAINSEHKMYRKLPANFKKALGNILNP